jgi:hypothetical protein
MNAGAPNTLGRPLRGFLPIIFRGYVGPVPKPSRAIVLSR